MPGPYFNLREWRRRKVFRGIGLYLLGSWTLLQVVELTSVPLALPDWTLTALLYVQVVVFPLAVWMAWRYEISDSGLVRTRPASITDDSAKLALGRSDFVMLAALSLVVAVVAWRGLISIRTDAEDTRALTQQAEANAQQLLQNSVAVLPFIDLSPEQGQSFLGDGIADTVLHVLSQVKGLTVSARTSSFAFRNDELTIEQIATELGVGHILEGSVQRVGEQMRVIARLIDAASGTELWSGNFDRPTDEIFVVQDDIAHAVATALQGTVTADQREKIDKRYQPDLEAFEQYVLGKRELDIGNTESVASAVRRFELAIELDPDYALVYSMLAHAITRQNMIARKPPGASTQRINALIDQALQIDPTQAEAWSLRGMTLLQDKQFEQSEAAIERALELNPNSADIWAGYWNFLLLAGRQEEALQAIRRAAELDPESIQHRTRMAQQLFQLGRAEQAIFQIRELLRRHPDSSNAYGTLARYLNQIGQPGEAMWYVQAARQLDPDNREFWRGVCEQHWQLWDIYGRLPVVKRFFPAISFLSMMAPLLAMRAFRFYIVAMKKRSADIYSGSVWGSLSPRPRMSFEMTPRPKHPHGFSPLSQIRLSQDRRL